MIKSMNELKPVDSEIRAIEIFEYIKEKLKEDSELIGYKVWGNPANSDNNKTYKMLICASGLPMPKAFKISNIADS